MNQNAPSLPSSAVKPSECLTRAAQWLTSGVALAAYLLVFLQLLVPLRLPVKPGGAEGLLVLTATLATLVALRSRLPAQNIILAAAIIACIGGVVHAVGAVTAIPFGPFSYADSAGPRIFNTVAWPIPLLWVVVLLNSRGVARLILRPWRKLRSYGFWLIGITVALTMLFDVALEPYAAVVKRYWLWHPTKLPLTWGGAPMTSFLGWAVTALLILAFATPALIDKRQSRSGNRPPDYHPLVVWFLAMLLFATGAAAQELWLPAAMCAGIGITVAGFALRGARW